MKKLIIIAALCAVTSYTYAQKGTWEIDGTVNFNLGNTKSNSTEQDINLTSVIPSVYYNISDNWAVGLGIGYAKADIDISGLSTSTISLDKLGGSLVYISPQVRYKRPIVGRFSWAPSASLSFAFGNLELDATVPVLGEFTSKPDMKGYFFGINFARFEYAISNHWNLSLNVGSITYHHFKVETEKTLLGADLTCDAFSLRVLNSTSLGVSYRF